MRSDVAYSSQTKEKRCRCERAWSSWMRPKNTKLPIGSARTPTLQRHWEKGTTAEQRTRSRPSNITFTMQLQTPGEQPKKGQVTTVRGCERAKRIQERRAVVMPDASTERLADSSQSRRILTGSRPDSEAGACASRRLRDYGSVRRGGTPLPDKKPRSTASVSAGLVIALGFG